MAVDKFINDNRVDMLSKTDKDNMTKQEIAEYLSQSAPFLPGYPVKICTLEVPTIDTQVQWINENHPDINYMTAVSDLTGVNVMIKSIDAIPWSTFIIDAIRNDIISSNTNLTHSGSGINIKFESQYPEKHLEQILMLSQAYLIKAGHKIEPDEVQCIDPAEYGLEPW